MWLHAPKTPHAPTAATFTLAHDFALWMLTGGKPTLTRSPEIDWPKSGWLNALDLWETSEAQRARVQAHLAVIPHDGRLRSLGLCAGYGGLEMAVHMACGARTVGYVERQAYAAAVLASRMKERAIDEAPIWDDLETFDCEPWRGQVDIICAGFPCQGSSIAGKRLGTEDARWLWPEVWRVTLESQARWLFIENVPGLLSVNKGQAFREILDDLASCGWAAEYDCLSAGSCSAPHLRDRLFLFAADTNRVAVRVEPERKQRGRRGARATLRRNAELNGDGGARDVADTSIKRREKGGIRSRIGRGEPGPERGTDAAWSGGEGNVADTTSERVQACKRGCRADRDPGWSQTVGGGGGVVANAARDEREATRGADEHEIRPDADRIGDGTADSDGLGCGTDERDLRAGQRDFTGSGTSDAANADHQSAGAEHGQQPGERPDLTARGSSDATDARGFGCDEGGEVDSGTRGQGGADATGGDQPIARARDASDSNRAGRARERSSGELDGGIGEECGSHVDRRGGPWTRHTVELVGRIIELGRAHWDWGRAPQPCIRGLDDEPATGLGDGDDPAYADKLHLIGNGVVKTQAAVAFAYLWERLHGAAIDVRPVNTPREVSQASPALAASPDAELSIALRWTGPREGETAPSGMLYGRVPGERWPYGPPSAHEPGCNLFPYRGSPGGLFCDCAASAEDDTEFGVST